MYKGGLTYLETESFVHKQTATSLTIKLTRYTSTSDSRCGTLVYKPTADVIAVDDTEDIFVSHKATITDDADSDTLILQLNNMG